MKKTVLFCLSALLIVGVLVSCSSSPKDETTEVITKGAALVDSSTSGGRTSCGWVQLWENGPRFAEFNVGSTIDNYSSSTEYTTANIGGYYEWGGTTNMDSVQTSGTSFSASTSDISGTGTIGTDTLGDTARLIWGENWKMPTKENLYNLKNKDKDGNALSTVLTTWEWCDGKVSGDSGYNSETSKQYVPGCTLAGWKICGVGNYSNNSIFLPAAGLYDGTDLFFVGDKKCRYWSSTPNNENAYSLEFPTDSRPCGNSVRAVLAE